MDDRKWRNLGLKLLAAGFSTLLMLGILELFVRAFIPVRDVGPAFTVYDPYYGKRLQSHFEAKRVSPEFEFSLHTNSLGMRDPEPVGTPTEGVVFLGDSFTMGFGVEDHESFPSLVRKKLAQGGLSVPVLNVGMGNNGNGRWLRFLTRDAAEYRPRLVVLQVMENDFDDNSRERLYTLEDGKLRAVPVPSPSFGRRVQGIVDVIPGLSYLHLVGLAWAAAEGRGLQQMLASGAAAPTQPAQVVEAKGEPSDELTYALVGASIDKAKALGADVVGLFVELTGVQRTRMHEVFAARGVKVFESAPKPKAPDLYFVVDGHWNAKGHRKVAELLAPELEQRLRAR